jgi:hypothetical protein
MRRTAVCWWSIWGIESPTNNYRVVSVIPPDVIPGLVPGTSRRTVLEQVPGTSPGMTTRGRPVWRLGYC